MMNDPHCVAVQGQGLKFSFGKNERVLNGLDITVDRGVIYGLLGPSGCGKTTLLQCIVGRHKPSGGEMRIYGKLPGERGCTVPGPGVGYMPQELALYQEMTIAETLKYFGRLYQMIPDQIQERISFLTNLLEFPDVKKQIKHLSGGQQRRVSFAAALLHQPPLIILDEPTVGVDPLLRKSIWDYLQTLARSELSSIIITTHYVEEARQAHVVGMMRDGRLLAEMNPTSLMELYQAPNLEDVFLKLCLENTKILSQSNEVGLNGLWKSKKLMDVSLEKQIQLIKVTSLPPKDHEKRSLSFTTSKDRLIQHSERKECGKAIRASANKLFALVTKNMLCLSRNIPFLIFQIIVPAFQAVVFCLSMGGEPFNLNLAIVNNEIDPMGQSHSFLQHISSQTIIQNNFTNSTLAIESVKSGKNWGVLYIGPRFTEALIDRFLQGIEVGNETIEDSTIKLYLDSTNQQIAMTLYSKIMQSFKSFTEDVLKVFNYNPLIASTPIFLETPIYGNSEISFTEYLAPGMICGITYIMAVSLCTMCIILERKEGLLDRSLVAGVHHWEVMISILAVLFLVMVLQVALVMVFTFRAFSIPCKGPVTWVVVACLLVGIEGMANGMLISSVTDDPNIATMIAIGSFYPSILLSGVMWPLEGMPIILQYISQCLPFTIIAHSVRSIISRGWDVTDHGTWEGFVVALAWILPLFFISSLLFKYRK